MYIKKNLSKKEMEDQKRKKRVVKRSKPADEPVEGQSVDLNKRRKLSQTMAPPAEGKKPWEIDENQEE
jgi:hypothetical protein